jgi:hypothetical protein
MLFSSAWTRSCVFFFVATAIVVIGTATSGRTNSGRYVGSAACADCHDEEYENFKKFSKKAHSGDSVKVMAGDLTRAELEECFVCHMTGFGKPGGFVSFEETPGLADAGCEVCHGPGYDHVDSGGDPELIVGDLSVADCEHCHNPERVAAFDFKPLLYGGAH